MNNQGLLWRVKAASMASGTSSSGKCWKEFDTTNYHPYIIIKHLLLFTYGGPIGPPEMQLKTLCSDQTVIVFFSLWSSLQLKTMSIYLFSLHKRHIKCLTAQYSYNTLYFHTLYFTVRKGKTALVKISWANRPFLIFNNTNLEVENLTINVSEKTNENEKREESE